MNWGNFGQCWMYRFSSCWLSGGRRVADTVDRAAVEVHIEEAPPRPLLEVDGEARALLEGRDGRRVRVAVLAAEHHPEADSGRVPEEERPTIAGRVPATPIKGDGRDDRAVDRAVLSRDDRVG